MHNAQLESAGVSGGAGRIENGELREENGESEDSRRNGGNAELGIGNAELESGEAMSGVGNNTFAPANTAVRAEVAQLFKNFRFVAAE